MVETVRPVVQEFDPRVCSRCKRNRKLCNCHYPYPTKQPLYSRVQYECDLQDIERLEQLSSGAVARQDITGIQALRVTAECNWMRKLCKAALFRTRMILASRKKGLKQSSNGTAIKEPAKETFKTVWSGGRSLTRNYEAGDLKPGSEKHNTFIDNNKRR